MVLWDGSDRIVKNQCRVTDGLTCALPIFRDDLETSHALYIAVAAVFHEGSNPTSGHYRTLLRLDDDRSTTSPTWLLMDDNCHPRQVQGWEPWMQAQVALLWFIRDDLFSVPTYLIRGLHHRLDLATMPQLWAELGSGTG
eukprot:Skav211150  [mRNA]  locus=scaffold413:183027:183446:+ [translate_table: standard]